MAGIVANSTSTSFPLATLYVGDLDPDITEAQLYERFSQTGQVLSIRVCRDQVTRQSLGYAYVNYQQPADAERALDTMNFDMIGGKPMRIMWSQRDPALRRSGVGNVFIKNLEKSIDNKELYDTFSQYGNILSCKIMIDENGESKGFGFVHFQLQESADKAVATTNNKMIKGKQVYVGPFISNEIRKTNNFESGSKYTNIFVKNFEKKLDDEKLNELFQKFGEITSGVVAKDKDGLSKGFGFVNFKTHESAEQAVNNMNGYLLDQERQLFVGPFIKKAFRKQLLARKIEERRREKAAKYQGINLYVKNLDDKIDDEELRQHFAEFGTITSAKVMTDINKRSKGFGFVCFSTPAEAAKAVSDMKGKIVAGKPLYVALAQRKEDRRNQLVSQYKQRNNASRIQNQNLYSTTQYYIPPVYTNANMYQTHLYPEALAAPRFSIAQPKQIQTHQPIYSQYLYQNQRRYPFNNYPTNQNSMNISQNEINHHYQARQRIQSNNTPYGYQQNRAYHQKRFPPRDQTAAQPQQSINVAGQEPLTTNMLAQASAAEQKQMLGERLYPLIQNMYPELAGKITGMLLEIDNAELLHMLDTPTSLQEKIEEAVNVLRVHQRNKVE